MMRLSIRWKLTFWYGAVLAVVLAAFSLAVFLVMRHQSLSRTDQGLAEELADVLHEIKRPSDPIMSLAERLNLRFGRHEGFDFQITRINGSRFFANDRLKSSSLPLSAAPTESPV